MLSKLTEKLPDIGILGRILPLDKIVEEATQEASYVTERHDVPNDKSVPEDLRDTSPRYLLTKDGFSVASRLHPEDKTRGSDSASTVLAIGLFPVLALFGSVGVAIGTSIGNNFGSLIVLGSIAITSLIAIALFVAIAQSETPKEALLRAGLGFIVPFIGLVSIQTFAGMGEGFFSVLKSAEPFELLILIGVFVIIPFIFFFAEWVINQGRPSFNRITTRYIGFWLILLAIVFIPVEALKPLPLIILGSLQAWLFASNNRRVRADQLYYQSKLSRLEFHTKGIFERHKEARRVQVENAKKDTTPFIIHGTALGVMTAKLDGYAPDTGNKFGQSAGDLSTHLLALGPTGSGKTSLVLRPLIAQIVRERKKILVEENFGKWGKTFSFEGNPYNSIEEAKTYAKNGSEVWVVADDEAKANKFAFDGSIAKGLTQALNSEMKSGLALVDITDGSSTASKKLKDKVMENKGFFIEVQKNPLYGILIQDGKSSLADEARGYSDLVIEPGVNFALLEGLRVEDVVEAISSISGASSSKSGDEGGATAFFNSAAREGLRHAAALYYAMCEYMDGMAEKGVFENSKASKWKKKWSGLDMVRKALLTPERNRDTIVINPIIKSMVIQLTMNDDKSLNHPGVGTKGLLDQAIAYATHVLSMDERTLGNVSSTLDQWMSPMMSQTDLLPWTELSEGVDPTIVLRGGVVGVNVPIFRYGVAGKLVQNLIRLRINTAIRRRADYAWNRLGECPVIMLIDEAQEILNEADSSMIAVARSLGSWYVCATQNVDGLKAKFGSDKADQTMDQFRSVIGIGNMSPDSQEFIAKRLGHGAVRQFPVSYSTVDYHGAARDFASLPIHDKSHELYPEFKAMARRGAGRVQLYDPKFVARRGVVPSDVNGKRVDTNLEGIDLDVQILHGGKVEFQELWNKAEMDAFLSKPRHAIAQVMRAGVIRRDVIEMNPIYSFNDDKEEGVLK